MEIEVFDRQSRRQIDLARLQDLGPRALKAVLKTPVPPGKSNGFGGLECIEVVFVSDDEIARVHEEFMDVPGATDVITFDHGEIVISADRAEEEGSLRHSGLDREAALYLIHGLLHLRGFDDHSPEDAEAMNAAQHSILDLLWDE